MFLPMIIQQATSLSGDALINLFALLFIAYNLKLLYEENDLSYKDRLIYYLLTFCVSISKYVYFPLVFLSLLLVKNVNINKNNKRKLIIISITIAIFSSVVWFLYSQNYVDVRAYIKEANVNPVEQAKYILSNPFNYIRVLVKTFSISGSYYLLSFVGNTLGYANILIPDIYIILMTILLFLLPFFEENNKSLLKWQKIITLLIFIILVLLVITGLYLTWSPLKFDKVAGVQGRYFIPIMILIFLTLIKANNNVKIKNLNIKYFCTFFILNIIVIYFIINNFLNI